MVQNQVLVKNIPVLKTGIFGAYYMGLLGLILGVITGIIAMLVNPVNGIIVLIVLPILMAIIGFILFALIGYGTRLGLGFCNGYQIDVENEKGVVTWKKIYTLKGAILSAFQMIVIVFPFSLIGGLIVGLNNIGAGLAMIIVIPIFMFIFGFLFGGLRTFGMSAGLSVAGGLPINIESANGKTTFRGTSAVKYGIVTAIDSFIIMVVISFFLLIVALMIPDMSATQLGTSSSAMMLGGLSNMLLAAKGIMLLLVVLLPIMGLVFGFISGFLSGFGLNMASKAINGFTVETIVQSTKISLQKMSILQTGIFVAVFLTFCSVLTIVMQFMAYLFLNNIGMALFAIIFGIIEYLIIGGIMGLVVAISVNGLKGYDIEGENIDKLVGSA